jgi:bifunctional DNA-binding transcriptional regulator/antitoxin component of YhaV-PrlF toxin-antitoxin module
MTIVKIRKINGDTEVIPFPKEIRRAINWNYPDELDMKVEGDGELHIVLNKVMPFIKYAQVHLRLLIHNEKRMINGTFRDKKTKEIVKGDIIEAVVSGDGTAEMTYKANLEWNNYIKEDYEGDREYIDAEWIDVK